MEDDERDVFIRVRCVQYDFSKSLQAVSTRATPLLITPSASEQPRLLVFNPLPELNVSMSVVPAGQAGAVEG